MKKRLVIALLIVFACLLTAMPAMAGDEFRFAVKSVEVYDGESVTPELLRDGKFADGTVTFSVKGKVCTVDENTGEVTGVDPGQVYLTAVLTQDGKTVKTANMQVTVIRKARSISLNTNGLQVYDAEDESILSMLDRNPEDEPLTGRILVMAAGKSFWPHVTISPDDVRNKRFTTATSNAEIVKITKDGQIVAVKRGECDLTVTSAQNPEAVEKLHVLVTQPVKRVVIDAPVKSVAAGQNLQLGVTITPDDATIQNVVWNSRNPKVATVDENGLVTAVSKGNVAIEAKSADGTNLTATVNLTVTQDVTEITIQETEINVATGKTSAQPHVQVLPQNANNRKVTWSSSDESVATVNGYGRITGRRRGECTVTCTSVSNPEVSASIPVHVIQMVTDIVFTTPKGLSIYTGDSYQLDWQVMPDDASITDVTFKSRNPKVAAVDQNGIVTGLTKGQADIEVKATDGSGKYRVYRVTVLKPVEGINAMKPMYYCQLGGTTNVKATVYPSDASDQRILWSISDESMGSIKSVGTSYGRVYGSRSGHVTVTATTNDGGFSTTTDVAIGDFNTMVITTEAKIDTENRIKLVFWNMSQEYTVKKVYFRVDCYDTQGQPMICNMDGVSTSFDGSYPLTLEPLSHTEHGRFNFNYYQPGGWLGYVVVTITGYKLDDGAEGHDWWIPEDQQTSYHSLFSDRMGEPTENTDTTEEGNG